MEQHSAVARRLPIACRSCVMITNAAGYSETSVRFRQTSRRLTAAASPHSHARRVLPLRSLQAATVSRAYQSKLPTALTLLIYIQDVSCSNLGRDTDYRDRFYFPCFPQSPPSSYANGCLPADTSARLFGNALVLSWCWCY